MSNQPPQPPPNPEEQPYAFQPARPVNPRLVFWTSGQGVVLMLLIACGVMVLIAIVTNLISGQSGKNFEVSVISCDATNSSLHVAKVGYTVRNTSKSTRDATLKIEYRDGAGNRLDTDTAYVRGIAPGDTVRGEESTLLDAPPGSAISCRIVGVS